MLHEVLLRHRHELIEGCRLRGAIRSGTLQPEVHGGARILDQLITTLRLDSCADPFHVGDAATAGVREAMAAMHATASAIGAERSEEGRTVEQLVHEFSDLRQSTAAVAQRWGEAVDPVEARAMNRCLDNAIACAVAGFGRRRETSLATAAEEAITERVGVLAHELRNHLQTVTLAVDVLTAGALGRKSSGALVVARSLEAMRVLIRRTLDEVRVGAGQARRSRLVPVAEFIADVQMASELDANARGCVLVVAPVEPDLAVFVDAAMLFAAVQNLLQNAYKFTRPGTSVTLSARGVGERVWIEVADHCGGLPDNAAEYLFLPFRQGAGDRSGLGLGLTMSRRVVEADLGTLQVRDVPGTGCVFMVDLPRHRRAASPAVVADDCRRSVSRFTAS